MTAILNGGRVTPIPTRFRFSDNNPVTGTPYARSRFIDLPGYAQTVIETDLGLTPSAWDNLVDQGEAYTMVGHRRTYSITRWLRTTIQHRKHSTLPGDVCPECWGTCVELDSDGSLTGRAGGPVLCFCAEPRIPVQRTPRPELQSATVGWPGAPRDYR